MTAEIFEKVTAGIQNVLISAAIIIGGFWTVITFSVLGQAEQARADLRKINTDIEKARAEHSEINQRMQQEAKLEVRIAAKQERVGGRRYISAIVEIKNVGSKEEALHFQENPFNVSLIEFSEDGTPIPAKEYKTSNLLVPIVSNLRAGSATSIPFFVPVNEPGLYLLAFRTGVSGEIKEVLAPGKALPSWSASVFMIVN